MTCYYAYPAGIRCPMCGEIHRMKPVFSAKKLIIGATIVVIIAIGITIFICNSDLIDSWMYEQDKYRYKQNAYTRIPDNDTGESRPRKPMRAYY